MSNEKAAPAHSASTPTAPCDVCDVAFEPGDRWWYHGSLRVYVHPLCATYGLVRGEDVTTHTMIWGQVPPDAEPQTTPQDAREGGRNSLEGVPGGERTSQGADGASVRSIGDRLRSAADYQDRPGAYDELRAMADEADRLERERHDADGHYHRVVGELSALKGRLDATRGDLAAQEGIAQEMKASLDRLHTWAGLLELLDAHWPEDIFPTLTDDAARDTGPRLVSALRRVDRAEAAVERVRALASRWDERHGKALGRISVGNAAFAIRRALDGGTEADRG